MESEEELEMEFTDKMMAEVKALKLEAREILLPEYDHKLKDAFKRIMDDEAFTTAVAQIFTMKSDGSTDNEMAMNIILNPSVFKGRIMGVVALTMAMLDL